MTNKWQKNNLCLRLRHAANTEWRSKKSFEKNPCTPSRRDVERAAFPSRRTTQTERKTFKTVFSTWLYRFLSSGGAEKDHDYFLSSLCRREEEREETFAFYFKDKIRCRKVSQNV